MPNIKASILSVKSDAKRHARNFAAKSVVRTTSRKVIDAVEAGNVDEAKALLIVACKTIDQAAASRVYHKNAAGRKKSCLARKINAMAK